MKFKSYNSCVEYLFSLERAGIKYDLKNIRVLSALSGNPYKKLKAIHIAGTNGKGSTASMVASVLKESKYKVGLYTSPHLVDFRERIRINGKMISKEYVINFTNELFKDIEKIKPSFFEATTAMAFKYFSDNEVDFAVIECGLGGRLDSTNILKPIVSVITSISKDHTEYLGNTIKSITLEKAGIVKSGVPCVCGSLSDYAKAIIKRICDERRSEFIDSSRVNLKSRYAAGEGFELIVSGIKDRLFLPLNSEYQTDNMKAALVVLCCLMGRGYAMIELSDFKNGLQKIKSNSGYGYRFEKISDSPQIVLDVSHNAEGLRTLKESLKLLKYRKLIIIFGMMSDKEILKCISELEKLNGFIILTKPEYKRAGEPNEFAKYITNKNAYVIKENVLESYKYAKSKSKKDDLILVTGSFFMVSDFLKFYKEK